MTTLLANSGMPEGLATVAPGWTPGEVIDILGPVLSEERRTRIENVIQGRTRTVATVVEGVVNTGNVSAVMRTAEALGFQSFHVISGDNPFKHSVRTTQGAQKWLDVYRWSDAVSCVNALKSDGYEIIVTHLGPDSEPLDALDFTRKTALIFGNELSGVSEEIVGLADRSVIIPSTGFVRSFNISVAAAIALHHAFRARETQLGQSGDLTNEEKERLTAEFYMRAVAHAEAILDKARPSG